MVRIATSRVAQVSDDDGAVNNEDYQILTNEGGRRNGTEISQVSYVPETEVKRRSEEEYRSERYKFDLCGVVEDTRVLQRPLKFQERIKQDVERQLHKKDAALSIIQVEESMNRNIQQCTADHAGSLRKKMLTHNVFESMLSSSLPKTIKRNFIKISESATDIS